VSILPGVLDTPGEASATFEVAGAEVREGDLDLVGLVGSRFLDGLLHIS
jgi:hypothetical protein